MLMENGNITNDEEVIVQIRELLREKFELETDYLGSGVLAINEFNSYADSEERYLHILDLGEVLVDFVRTYFDIDCDYDTLCYGCELVLKVIG